MKKYLLTSAAAFALGGLFIGCTHDFDYEASAQSSVTKTYEQAFKTAFGQPDPNNEWGFGTSTAKAATREGTRTQTEYGFTIPTNPTFSGKNNIDEPGTINKPTINEANATIVISQSQTGSQNYDNAIVYVKNGATLTLPDWSSLQNTKFYLSSGCTLVVGNLYLKGNTDFVNDGGTIQIGNASYEANFVLENFTGTFWNNGPMTISGNFTESNTDGGKVYNGSNASISAKDLYLFKNNLFRNEGTITLTGTFTADQYGHKIYNSGTITTPNIILEKDLTLWNEGTITAANGNGATMTFRNDNIDVYNGTHSTFKLASMNLYNNYQLVVNDGNLDVDGDIFMRNTSAEIVNNGTLTGASIEMLAGAKFYNSGFATIDGKTHIANSQAEWKNEGTYTTGDYEITDYATKIYNNCKMIVHKSNDTGEFKIYGEFVLDAGASVVTDKFFWVNKSNFFMGDLSLLKVRGDFVSNNYDRDCGIHTYGSQWAVIQAGAIKQYNDVNDQFRMAYYGNLWVDTQSHFSKWYKDDKTDQPNYKFFGNGTFGHEGDEGCPTIPVTNTGSRNYSCTPGYNPDGPEPSPGPDPDPDPNAIVIRVICEDLTVNDPKNDFDFNDAVFDVKLIENDTQVDITLLAAGGTLPLYIGDNAEEHEIHYAFETTNHKGITTGTMLTTEAPRKTPHKYNLVSCLTAKLKFDLKPEWLTGWSEGDGAEAKVKTVAKNIPVLVRKLVNQEYTLVELQCEQGKATAKVGIKLDSNNKFKWCDERVNINDTFTYEDALGNDYGGFTLFVQGFLSADEWYRYNGVLTDDLVRRYLGQ